MNRLLLITTVLFMVLTLSSCNGIDGPEPAPTFTEMTIHLEYKGLDDFQGELSRIAIFITDENGNFIVNYADKIDENTFVAECRPGKYVVSAEYVDPDKDNIILESTKVELKAYQPLKVILEIDFNKTKEQKEQIR